LRSRIGSDTIADMVRKKRVEGRKKKNEPGWSLYILRCRDNTFYTGITTDLKRRLMQHNDGTASRYTRSRKPATLVYSETCSDRSTALKRECEVKKMPREEKKRLITQRERVYLSLTDRNTS